MGLIPENTVLTERNEMAKPWDGLTDWEKKVYARYMEAFAGYLNYTDEQLGRLLSYLKKLGQYENTLIVLVADNGASGEGGPNGSVSELYHLLSMRWPELTDGEGYNKIGTEDAQNNYPPGWAWAGNSPLKWYKSWVHAGGVKVPFIISHPERIKDKGGIRQQYHHVIDVNATVLEACGIEQPEVLNGVRQEKKPSISMCYSFDEPGAPRRRVVQYYEMLGNRGIWADGWKAVANHVESPSFDEDVWELYHTDEDFSEARDLSAQYPEKLRELISLWWHEAGMYGVLPLLGENGIKNAELKKRTQEIIDKFGLPIDPLELVGGLNVAYQQMVEIMKAYRRDSAIIAFDEPTAPLTDSEIKILFRLITKLKEEGKVVLYVSRRLAEIFQITDEIIVLKDGRFAKKFITAETNEQELITAMIGRDIGDAYSELKRNDKLGDVLLDEPMKGIDVKTKSKIYQ